MGEEVSDYRINLLSTQYLIPVTAGRYVDDTLAFAETTTQGLCLCRF